MQASPTEPNEGYDSFGTQEQLIHCVGPNRGVHLCWRGLSSNAIGGPTKECERASEHQFVRCVASPMRHNSARSA
eukprot:m.969427 g.969427  ORF g.969427 m.969427 type:complete len:75 (+) comp23920_c0_seq3:2441-2665(+)